MTLTINSVIKRSSEIVYSDMDGETVMMSIEQGEYYGIDTIGTQIWDMLEEEKNIKDICSSLNEKYNVEESVCQKDVINFLENMYERKIIEMV